MGYAAGHHTTVNSTPATSHKRWQRIEPEYGTGWSLGRTRRIDAPTEHSLRTLLPTIVKLEMNCGKKEGNSPGREVSQPNLLHPLGLPAVFAINVISQGVTL